MMDTYGYIARWQGKRIEVYADTAYAAQELAAKEFQKGTRRKVKGYDISLGLAEVNGVPYVHVATS